MTKYLLLLVKLGLSAGLIWYVFARIDFASAWTTLLSIPLTSIVVAIGLLLLQLVLGAYRVQELLAQLERRYRLPALIDACWVGAFFSQTFISFVGGDAMRIWRMIRSQIPAAAATQAILLDRIAGFAGVVVVLLVTIPFLVPILQSLEMEIGLVLVAAGALGFIVSIFVLRRLPAALQERRGVSVVARFASRGLGIARSGRGAIFVLGLSIMIQVANVVILFVLARGLSMEISLTQCLLFMPTVLFLSMLPISIAGWGVREGAMVTALAVIGVPSHQSLALSICFGLCLVFVSLPGGIIWFTSRNKTLAAKEASALSN